MPKFSFSFFFFICRLYIFYTIFRFADRTYVLSVSFTTTVEVFKCARVHVYFDDQSGFIRLPAVDFSLVLARYISTDRKRVGKTRTVKSD